MTPLELENFDYSNSVHIETGWCVINMNDPKIHPFAFKDKRKEAIKYFVSVMDLNWKHWYRKGYRCIKVKQTFELI